LLVQTKAGKTRWPNRRFIFIRLAMSIPTISPRDAQARQNDKLKIIDVREPGEYRQVRAQGAISLPLSRLEKKPEEIKTHTEGAEAILLTCKSGARSAKAAKLIEEHADGCAVYVIDGGTDAWVAANLPHQKQERAISLQRQVQIAAGSLVFLGTLLGASVSAWWLVLSGFVGAGLVFAGITNSCGMAMLIAKMPWNQ
jgi:rhodanese-related sulfurtransferase